MTFSYSLEKKIVTPGRAVLGTQVFTADGGIAPRSVSIPDSSTDLLVAFTLDVSEVQVLYMLSDYDITIETNNGSTPADTLELKAGVPYVFDNGAGFGSTSVDGDSNSAQKVLGVASTTGFEVGQTVLIDRDGSGGGRERGRIASIQDGVSITLQDNLANTHTAVQADTVMDDRFVFHTDITALYVTNASGSTATLEIDGAVDSTP